MNTCRLCLYKGDDNQVIPLFKTENLDLIDTIKECVSIEVTSYDKLPTTVCVSCIKKVKDWADFKATCLITHNVLVVLNRNKPTIEVEEVHQPNVEISNVVVLKLDHEESGDEEFEEESRYISDNIYVCDICPAQFDSCFAYLDHQPTHNGSAVFKCDQCGDVFDRRECLVEHDRNHKRPCPKCGKTILKSSMKLHLIKHTDRYRCVECQNRFNSRASLMQHVITMHTKIKDHICETCGKRFSSKTAMTVHLKSHSDDRLYECSQCNYAGRTASAVYVHMSTHANETRVCEVCSKIFKSTRNLNDHLRRVHSKVKKHKCSYCGKTFVDKYMLTVHLRCHTGVRPYQCRMCDKAFIRSDGLKEHMTTHGQRVWYECNQCNRKFTSKKGLTRHQCPLISS